MSNRIDLFYREIGILNLHGCKVNTKIVRLFNTYGPYMDEKDGRVISNFFSKIQHNEPLVVHGDGSSTISFCYVSDTIDGIIKMMNSDE